MSQALENGIFGSIARGVKQSRAIGRARREYTKELRLSSKVDKARKRRQKAEKAYRNPSFTPDMLYYPIGGGTVGDAVGIAGGAMVSQLVTTMLPCGASGGVGEVVEQLLIVVGVHFVAPESVRRGATLGALIPPVVNIIRQIAATAPRPLDGGAGLSGLVDFNPSLLPEVAAGAASTPATVFNGYSGSWHS